MTMFPDGALVRQQDRPEVWKIDAGKRRWVPDEATVQSLGGWNAVRVLAVGEAIDNPLGPMLASVLTPAAWSDGALIAAWPNPKIYVMQGGLRRWIVSPQVFQDRGYNWDAIHAISDVEMNAIPEGDPDRGPTPTELPPEFIVATGRQSLGAGHFIETTAKFIRATGTVSASTTTETVTWLGGYHGAVNAILVDRDEIPVPGGQSPLFRYGVDGTVIGNSKRTDAWSFTIDPAQTAAVRNLVVFHVWAPDEFQKILEKWAEAAKPLSELLQAAAAVAKAIAAI